MKTWSIGLALAALLSGFSCAREAVPTAPLNSTATPGTQLTGEIRSVNPGSRTLTVARTTGVSQDVVLAPGASITRDGVSVGLDQLQPGDQIRASFEPGSDRASSLVVSSSRSPAPIASPAETGGVTGGATPQGTQETPNIQPKRK